MSFEFESYNPALLEKIEEFLNMLRPWKKRIFKEPMFPKKEIMLFSDKDQLLAKLEEDIYYQKQIAITVIKYSERNDMSTKLISYYWKCELEAINNQNYLSVDLYIKSEKHGNIIFPIAIALLDVGQYVYREILHIDSALETTKKLLAKQ